MVYKNEAALKKGANPYDMGTSTCCGFLKTRALLDALKQGGYDAAFGGARREGKPVQTLRCPRFAKKLT